MLQKGVHQGVDDGKVHMILVRQPNGQELICQGKGIGWHKRSGDEVDEALIERRFLPENEAESRHFQQLFSEIEDAYWSIAEELLDYARSRYALKVSEKVILPLCDHMAGSVERYRKGGQLENPMLWDVKRVYPKEFQVGKYALRLLKEHYNVEMMDDEAAFLAYHIVIAQLGNSPQVAPDLITRLASSVISLVEQSFQITLNEEDWNYQRFLTHLKFFVNRIATREPYPETEEDELYTELKAKHPHVRRCVERIADYILIHFHYDISSEEKLYLLIHISRVIKAAKRSKK